MSATADIITDVKNDVLAIPIQSLTVRQEGWEETAEMGKRSRKSKKESDFNLEESSPVEVKKKEMIEVVFVVKSAQELEEENDGERKKVPPAKKGEKLAIVQPVKVGISSENYYEVLEGLNEGDEIVTGSYRAISRDLNHLSEVEKEGAQKGRRGKK